MKSYLLLISCCCAIILFSCSNKTKSLITKKWDCVQVENVTTTDKVIQTAEDSTIALKIDAALKNLTWTFNSNNTYQCSVGNTITTQGIYKITDDAKTLICTPQSMAVINNYHITAISEEELILTSIGIAVPVVMHFRPH